MERIIQSIVEFDKKGRKIVREAEKARRDMVSHMDEYKSEMCNEYRQRSENRVESFRQQAQLEKEEQLAEIKKNINMQLERLNSSYREHSDEWIRQAIARCTGRRPS